MPEQTQSEQEPQEQQQLEGNAEEQSSDAKAERKSGTSRKRKSNQKKTKSAQPEAEERAEAQPEPEAATSPQSDQDLGQGLQDQISQAVQPALSRLKRSSWRQCSSRSTRRWNRFGRSCSSKSTRRWSRSGKQSSNRSSSKSTRPWNRSGSRYRSKSIRLSSPCGRSCCARWRKRCAPHFKQGGDTGDPRTCRGHRDSVGRDVLLFFQRDDRTSGRGIRPGDWFVIDASTHCRASGPQGRYLSRGPDAARTRLSWTARYSPKPCTASHDARWPHHRGARVRVLGVSNKWSAW